MTFFSTVSHGKRAYCWNTMPRSGLGPSTGLPSTVTVPSVGTSRPPMMFKSVDLPQPDGPTTVMNSFSWMSRSTPLSATISPLRVWNFFTTWSIWTFTAEPFPAIR